MSARRVYRKPGRGRSTTGARVRCASTLPLARYDLSKETELSSGTLYPILVRLEERGFLESKWESAPEPGRPPRHLYRLTAKGGAHARGEVAADDERSLDAPEGSRA